MPKRLESIRRIVSGVPVELVRATEEPRPDVPEEPCWNWPAFFRRVPVQEVLDGTLGPLPYDTVVHVPQ